VGRGRALHVQARRRGEKRGPESILVQGGKNREKEKTPIECGSLEMHWRDDPDSRIKGEKKRSRKRQAFNEHRKWGELVEVFNGSMMHARVRATEARRRWGLPLHQKNEVPKHGPENREAKKTGTYIVGRLTTVTQRLATWRALLKCGLMTIGNLRANRATSGRG